MKTDGVEFDRYRLVYTMFYILLMKNIFLFVMSSINSCIYLANYCYRN